MNQKQFNDLFKGSEKKIINKKEFPIDIQKKLLDDNYTLMQEQIRENTDLLLLQDKIYEEPIILMLIERDPYEIEIIQGVFMMKKFNNLIFTTRTVKEELLFIVGLVQNMHKEVKEVDYLQVITIENNTLIHTQEIPEYKKSYTLLTTIKNCSS